MNCKDVRENLSMYIDDMLDKQIRTLVEEHLAVCEACRQEHESLVRVIEELKVAGTMKAPEGFLETLHERLDEPSYWERIKELLFVPAQIKIPLEFAALSVVAVLVFTVYSLYMPGDQMVFTMKDASVGKTVSAPVVHEAEALKQDALPQTEIAADTDYVEAVKPQAVELALVLVKEPAAAGRAGTYSATRALSEEKGVSAHQAKLSRALPKAEAPAEKSTDAADESKE
ncbi:MAG TPA: zf-HC2 domain-containing protein, partial [Deltaproteobacteria bacterium]|nr:zf-HC2 domain-containing protein [Deltaproteobacteria bacterium]